MGRLALSVEKMKPHYQIVVIGTGYGGGIAASRLARAGQTVCVLERGREFIAGEFPDTLIDAVEETQTDSPEKHHGKQTALFDFRFNPNEMVLLGCGLGGTSLINGNVSIQPDPRVFDDGRWPQAFLNDLDTLVAKGYERATDMLKPTPYPTDFPPLPKLRGLGEMAGYMGQKFMPAHINVNFEDKVNHVGMPQQACKLCGDCMTGCNHTAKNTTAMNYLPDAYNHGAEFFTEVSVKFLEKKDGRWLIHYQVADAGQEKFSDATLFVTADIVIVSAGTLGSTEIMLRSKEKGLSLSDRVGYHYSGNGDAGGFAYNTDQEMRAVGFGDKDVDKMEPVGPVITGIIDMRDTAKLDDGLIVEEGSFPGAVSSVLPLAMAVTAKLEGEDTDSGLIDKIKEEARELSSDLLGAYHGAMQNSLVYLIMSHDGSNGRLQLQDDRIRIVWPGVGDRPFDKRAHDVMKKATEAVGGTFIDDPIRIKELDYDIPTVHPLGGCVMAADAAQGVVNHKGQVFADTAGEAVHEGLYISDGSVIPRSLGVNPLITISAVTERAMALLAHDHGWHIDYTLPSKARPLHPDPTIVGAQFSESMEGYFSTKVTGKEDYQQGFDDGKADGSSFRFVVTIISHNLHELLTDPQHRAALVGTVVAPKLSAEPILIQDGEFRLWSERPDGLGQWHLGYAMQLLTEDERTYFMDGFKTIVHDPGFKITSEITTLYITLYDGDSNQAPVMGKGILHISGEDIKHQMSTVKITHAKTLAEKAKAWAEAGRFLLGSLLEIYWPGDGN